MSRRLMWLAAGLWSVAVVSAAQADNPIVPDGAKLEKLYTRSFDAKGGLTEGATVGPDGAIYFTDITLGQDKSKIIRFDPKTKQSTVFAEDAFKANGLAFDTDGNLLACEGSDIGGRVVSKWDLKTKQRTVIAEKYQGKKFNAPNDLALDVDGRIYFTDPRYLGDEPRELEHRAVYRINTDGSIEEVTHDIEKPNGIAISRDEKWMYVADHNNGVDKIIPGEASKHGAMKIYAYPLGANGLPNGPKKTLVDYGDEPGCDGMCIDKNGNIYLTDRSPKRPGVRVIEPKEGKEIAFIATGAENQSKDPVGLPSNVTFGLGEESKTLYVTVDLSLYRIPLKVEGYQIPFADETSDRNWTRIELDPEFRSEGVAVGDLDGDGKNDLVAGDYWYQQPAELLKGKWAMKDFRPAGKFVAGVGYSNSFCNYTWDVDQDGQLDIIVVGFPGEKFHWYKNPGKANGPWSEHVIWTSICNESPDFADITGDGKPEFVFGSQPESQMGYCPLPTKAAAQDKWAFTAISAKGDPGKNGTFKYYHGLGYGDINQDGRTDVLIAHGWWQQPEKLGAGEWAFHPYALAQDGVNPMPCADIHVDDLDLDGDQDLIASSAHSYGVWWFENVGTKEKPQFKYHAIDQSHSQTHAMEYVDVNGDGKKDILTGKRFFAHNGGDPGAFEPVRMFWYDIRKSKGHEPEFVRHEILAGRDTGIGTQFQAVDINKDGKLDIALSNKKGVNILIQK